MRNRILATTAIAAMAGLGLAASPAQAAPTTPAKASIAMTIPPGCNDGVSQWIASYDSSGNLVDSSAVYVNSLYQWSGSGASVGFVTGNLQSSSDGDYALTVDRWTNGSTTYNGPGGTISQQGSWGWNPASTLWLTNNSSTGWRLTGYKTSRPSVGFNVLFKPCP